MARTEAATTAAREFKADEVFLHEGAYGVRVGLFGRRSGCCKSFLGERHAVVFLGPHVGVPKTLVLGLRVEGASVRNAKLSLPLPLTSSHAVGRSSSASMAATCSSTMAEAVLEPSDLASRRSSKCLCRSSSDKARALQQRPEQGKDERERGVERARSSASTLTMAERVARSGTDGRTNLTSAPAGLPPSGLGATAFVRHRDVSIVFLFIVVVASRQR